MSIVSYGEVLEAIDSGSPWAVALVLDTVGSTPGRAGMRALIDSAGGIRGTIGGGAMEAAVQQEAVLALRTGMTRIMQFTMEGTAAGDGTPICGGRMRILVDPCPALGREPLTSARAAQSKRERGILLTLLQGSSHPKVAMQWVAEGNLPTFRGFPGSESLAEALVAAEPRFAGSREEPEPDGVAALIEPVIPRPMLVIFGAGHVGQGLAHQARMVGFDLAIVDDRPELVVPARFPQGSILHYARPADAATRIPMTRDSYVVLVGRDFQQDLEALAACIRLPIRYIGMIGSQRKVALVIRDLLAAGLATPELCERVHAPVGLELGAVTVPEIAVSIVAELIAVRHGVRKSLPP